jgi:hypothetical protein
LAGCFSILHLIVNYHENKLNCFGKDVKKIKLLKCSTPFMPTAADPVEQLQKFSE